MESGVPESPGSSLHGSSLMDAVSYEHAALFLGQRFPAEIVLASGMRKTLLKGTLAVWCKYLLT